MIHRLLALAALFVIASAMNCDAGLEKSDRPFAPGERLEYVLKWGKIPAGRATFEVRELTDVNGETAYHFVMVARTNRIVDAVYKVRDRAESFAAADWSGSLLYRKQQKEGDHERDIEVTFDRDEGMTQYTNFGESRAPVEVGPGTFDPLSVFYAIRCLDPSASAHEVPVTDGKRCESAKIQAGELTTLKTADGVVDAWLIEPDMSKVGGVFSKSKNATLRVWLSADDRRVPLRFSSSVKVGSFHGVLVSHRRGEEL